MKTKFLLCFCIEGIALWNIKREREPKVLMNHIKIREEIRTEKRKHLAP